MVPVQARHCAGTVTRCWGLPPLGVYHRKLHVVCGFWMAAAKGIRDVTSDACSCVESEAEGSKKEKMGGGGRLMDMALERCRSLVLGLDAHKHLPNCWKFHGGNNLALSPHLSANKFLRARSAHVMQNSISPLLDTVSELTLGTFCLSYSGP